MSAAKPTPAPRQIWRADFLGGDRVVLSVEGPSVQLSGARPDDASYFANAVSMQKTGAWSCIGVETDAGHVMVGERRRIGATGIHYGAPGIVERVIDGTLVLVRPESLSGGGTVYCVAAVATWPLVSSPQASPSDQPIPASPPDPRATREAHRREIDAVLAADARAFPVFATARRCAVMAACEGVGGWTAATVAGVVDDLHKYEKHRGGLRTPEREALRWFEQEYAPHVVAAYERARSLP